MLLAAQDELLRHGYADFSIQRVAERAGVNKTTIYRRWRTREDLIGDLITVMAETSVPIPDTGDFLLDLNAFGHELTRVLAGRSGRVIRALLAAAASDPRLQAQLTAFYEDRYGAAEQIVERAVERGDLDPEVDAMHVIRTLAGPLYYSLIIYGRAPTAAETSQALAATRAYVRPWVTSGSSGPTARTAAPP